MEWFSLKEGPGAEGDGQGDVAPLPTRLAESAAPGASCL